MKAEQLRKSILQLAIQGKLVPQDPNDEPASVLLERIRAEKQRLIKEGKLKKDKNDSVIFKGDDNRHYEKVGSEVEDITDDLPFEIPDNWVFVRLSTVCWLGDVAKSTGEKLPYLDAKTLRGKPDKTYLTEGKVVDVGEKVILVDGENSGEVFDIPFRGYMGSTFKTLEKVSQLTFGYLNVVLDYYRDTFRGNKIGAAIPHLNKNLFKSLLIGIPPLAEQARIVAEIEKFEPLIAEYDKLEQQATKLDDEIYDKLKKSILQYAIQGKLVPQDPNDEPASVLLERIRAEKKAKLAKKYVDSYIYKGDDNCYYEKVGETVTNISDEIPFDLPENWAWIRLGYVIDFSKSDTITASQIDPSSWVLDLEDIEKDSGRLLQKKAMRETQSKSDKHSFCKGNVLYSKLRPYLNKVIVADDDGYCTTEILAFDFGQHIAAQYAQIYLMSPHFVDYAMAGAYGVKMPRIGSSRGNSALMPIPPFNEQSRVVERYNTICEQLKDKD